MIVNESDTSGFSQPRHQDKVGILVEILYSFQNMVRIIWPVILLLIFDDKKIPPIYIYLGIAALLLLIILFGYLQYRNFIFYIDEEKDEFILHRGIFQKKKLVFKLSNIQQVNINQSFIQKLVGVYAVELETAGSSKSEVTIRAVSKKTALLLRARLLNTSKDYEKEISREFIEESEDSFINIHWYTLLKVGLTSDYAKSVALMVAFAGAVYGNLQDFWLRDEANETQFNNFLSSLNNLETWLTIAGGLIAIIFLFNLIRTGFIFFGFKVVNHGKSLLFSYGLLSKKNTIIHPGKVQMVGVLSNYILEKLHLRIITIHQASSDPGSDKKDTVAVPGCNLSESDKLLKIIFDTIPEKGRMLKPNIRKVFAAIVRFILFPVSAFIVWMNVSDSVRHYEIFMVLYILAVSIFVYVSYRNSRLWVSEAFIFMQSGIWDIRNEIMEPYKIQAITTRQNIWHRKANVGHVILHTAGGDVAFKFANFSIIESYVNEWLYRVETSEKVWM